jgi:sugar O-acyltransferase (sialic acid O-acetyltransferase NeuD family)
MSTLSIVGAGGHGIVVADAASAAGRWSAIEFYDDSRAAGSELHGHPVRGNLEALLARACAGRTEAVVAIGNNARRLSLSRELAGAGVVLATVMHPAATISPRAQVGAGSVVFAGAVINIAARLGLATIINTGATVDHDCVLGDGVHICPGVHLAGNVTVGEQVWIGIGACVTQGMRIDARAMVGAGAVVIRDVEAGTTVIGNPARVLRHE